MKTLFAYISLLSSLTFIRPEDTFEVRGGQVIVLAGENATLPCHLTPKLSAVNLKVEWTSSPDTSSIVHVYENQKDSEAVDPSYRGRTSLFKEELQKGNTSLKLIHAKLTDEGNYICAVHSVQSPTWYDDAVVQVSVKGGGSLPVVSIGNPKDGGLELECMSTGWHPEPEVVWLDSDGHVLKGVTETPQGTDGLYNITGQVVVHKGSNKFTCRIQQQLISHSLETKINIPDDLFPKSYIKTVIISAAIPLLIISIIGILLCLYCGILERSKKQQVQSWDKSGTPRINIPFKLVKQKDGDLVPNFDLEADATRKGSETASTSSSNPSSFEPMNEWGCNEMDTTDGKDEDRTYLSFLQFAKQHVLENERLKKQLHYVNTSSTKYKDVIKCLETISLDTETAHHQLKVDNKNVCKLENKTKPLKTEKRFKAVPCVLGTNAFSKGRHYFVVEILQESWILGMVRKSINREKRIEYGVKNGAWTLRRGQGKVGVHDGSFIPLYLNRELKQTNNRAKKGWGIC